MFSSSPVQWNVPQAPPGPVHPSGGALHWPDGVIDSSVHSSWLWAGDVAICEVRVHFMSSHVDKFSYWFDSVCIYGNTVLCLFKHVRLFLANLLTCSCFRDQKDNWRNVKEWSLNDCPHCFPLMLCTFLIHFTVSCLFSPHLIWCEWTQGCDVQTWNVYVCAVVYMDRDYSADQTIFLWT